MQSPRRIEKRGTVVLNVDRWQNKDEAKKMTGAEIKETQKLLAHWASLSPEEKRAKYLESIPQQVWASMAFEGEHVSLEMLEEYLKSLERKKKEADTSSGGQRRVRLLKKPERRLRE